MDKAVNTKDDYIEELEMRFEESADIWHLTNNLIYGGKGFIVEISSLKRQLREAKIEIKSVRYCYFDIFWNSIVIFHLVGLFWLKDCVTVVSIFKTMKIRISKYLVCKLLLL